jgi:hypothetical protein
MIANPAKEFTSITVSCFDVPLDVLWQELELLFVEFRLNVNGETRRLIYEEFGPAPTRSGAVPPKGGIFTPGRGSEPVTAMVTNLIDGWQTLCTAASERLACACWQFTVSNSKEYPRNAFTFIQGGSDRRVVSAQLDTQWIFLAEGDVLDIETEAVYKCRRIRDRVTPEYVLSVAERAGFPIGDDAFWATDESSIYFAEERRRSSR